MPFNGSGSTISSATDVFLSGPQNNQVLTYNSGTLKWVNQTATGGAVTSVAGRTGAVTLAKADVGLANVDNTSDASKPISTATQTALDAKADEVTTITGTSSLSGGGSLAANRTLSLVNDSTTPGNSMYYGTNSSGTKGYFTLPAGGGSAAFPGIVQLDDFAGANDDAKLTAALTYVQAQTYIPAIQLPDRTVSFSQTRTPFSGLKIIGPGPHRAGPKNLELSSGKFTYGKVSFNGGNGTNSWWYGTGTYYDVYFGNIAIQYGSTSQFWHQPSGTLYATEFHSMTHYGAKHIFGTPTAKALLTQTIFSGHWTVVGFQDTQFTIGGSDNAFWVDNLININSPSTVAGAGRPMMIFDFLQKTKIGYIYMTCENDWAGIEIQGGSGLAQSVYFFGGSYEGRSTSNMATRPAIDMQGGHAVFYSPWTAFFDDGANAPGAFVQSGGVLTVYSPTYERAATTAATHPWLYQTGGTAQIYQPAVAMSGEQMRIRWSNGTTQTVGLNTNTVTV